MKNKLIFYVLIAIQSIAFNFAHPVTPTLIKSLNLDNSTFGIAYSSMALSSFLFSQFWSYVCNKKDDRYVSLIGSIFYGLAQFLFVNSTSLSQIVFARFLGGGFVAAINISNLVYIIRNTDEKSRGQALMTFTTVVSVSSALGYLVGGYIGNSNIFIAFYSQIVIMIICSILYVLLLKKNDIPPNEASIKDINPFIGFKLEKSINIILTLLLIITFVSTTASTIYDQSLNYYLKDIFNFTPSSNGTIKAISALLILIVNSTITLYLMRNNKSLIGLMFTFVACSIALTRMIITKNLGEFLMFNYAIAAINSVHVPIIQQLVTTQGEQNKNIVGTYNALKSLGWIVGGIVAGISYKSHHHLPFLIATIAFVACGIIVLLIMKSKKQSVY